MIVNKNFNMRQFIKDLFYKETKIFNFLRFGMIGVINTIHYYLWYLLFLKINLPYVISHTIAFTLSMIGSYFLNCYITFKIKPTLKKFIKYPLTTLSNYIISTFSLYILVDAFNINSSIAALLASILPIPITFMVTQYILKAPNNNSENKDKKIDKVNIFKNLFAVILLLLFAIGCFYYAFDNKAFAVDDMDNVRQFMLYIPFVQKTFLVDKALWSWNYGLGGDVFSEFSYYYSTNPIFYLMLLLRKIGIGMWNLESTLHWRLRFAVFKQFLAMISIYSLLKYEGKKTHTSLIGAMVYGGCINFLALSLYNDYMADAYIWIPITILGWRIYEKTHKWFLFVIGAALTAANSFYFGYMSFVYYIIFILLFMGIKGSNLKEKILSFFREGLNHAFLVIIALCLSAAAFIPSVLALLKSDRFSKTVNILNFYDIATIKELIKSLFFYPTLLGFPLIIIIILILPWRRLNSNTKKKTILAVLFILLYFIPYTGKFFNGFSYPTDRWYYLLIFSVAYALPDWIEESDRLKAINLAFFVLVSVFTTAYFYLTMKKGFDYTIIDIRKTKNLNITFMISSLSAFLILTLKRYITKDYMHKILNFTLLTSIAITILINNRFFMSTQPRMLNTVLNNSCMENMEEKQVFSGLKPSSNDFYRVIFKDLKEENAPFTYDYYGTSAYNSLIEGNLHRWFKVDHNVSNPYVSPSRYKNFDDRLFLETLFDSKYLVTYKKDKYTPPKVYNHIKSTDNYDIYENKNVVGFDLWYSSIISKEEYNNMNIAMRDAMLLQTAMVEKAIPDISRNTALDNAAKELTLDWKNSAFENVEYHEGNIKAGKNGFINIPINNNSKYNDGEVLFSMNIVPVNGQMIKLAVNEKSTIKMDENYPYSYPINDFTFKLRGDTRTLKISISEGSFVIKDAKAWFNSYKFYPKWVKERNKYNLENLYIKGGKVKGSIKNEEKGILALNIPFTKGWSAKVNGKKQELIKVNGILTGLALEPGYNDIELKYITPGLILGLTISAVTLFGIISYGILRRENINKKVVKNKIRNH